MKNRKRTILLATICLLVTGAFISVTTYSHAFIELEALAEDTPGQLMGHCEERDDDCIATCPGCNAPIYAAGHHGPAYDITGLCPEYLAKWKKEHGGESGND